MTRRGGQQLCFQLGCPCLQMAWRKARSRGIGPEAAYTHQRLIRT
jgi:hypothetical protein